jgi:hypothetical protein
MRRVGIVGASLVLASCSVLIDFDGLVNPLVGTDASSPVDASVDVAVIVVDATFDAPSVDAGTDAPVVIDAAVDAPFCATHPGHTFCDDFDSVPLATNWVFSTNASKVTLDPTIFESAPNSAKATSPDPPDGSSGFDDIEHDFPSGTQITIASNIKMTGTSTSCDFIFIEFHTQSAGAYNYCYFDISYFGGGAGLEVECTEGTAGEYYMTKPVSAGQPNWDRFSLSIDIATLVVSGSINGGTPVTVTMPSSLTDKDLNVGVGVPYNGQGECIVNADNVTVDVN